MNKRNRHYGSRMKFWSTLFFAIMAIFLCAIIGLSGHVLVAAIGITLISCALNLPQARTCAVTLSVPEILMDVLDAFKLETPELFGPNGFGKDFSSNTAVLGDAITAKIASIPATAAYNAGAGGFKNGAQDVTTLITDVPVTLDQFRHVPIKVGYLTSLSSKLPLYKEAIRNYGYALGKYVVDTALGKVVAANFTHSVTTAIANVSLDTFDGTIRTQMNTQKMFNRGRFALVNSAMANALGQDDRVRSNLFYGELNGDQGYRIWKSLAGFNWIREYPDLPVAGNLTGFAADNRAIVVASRQLDFANANALALGVPQVMDFHSIQDPESGLFMTGVGWQEAGTGDVYVSAGILFGVSAGAQGGAANSITDQAGLILKSA